MAVKNKLRELRKQLGLTQEETARRVNVPLRSYAGWENGYNEPSVQSLKKLASFFQRPIGWFLD